MQSCQCEPAFDGRSESAFVQDRSHVVPEMIDLLRSGRNVCEECLTTQVRRGCTSERACIGSRLCREPSRGINNALARAPSRFHTAQQRALLD